MSDERLRRERRRKNRSVELVLDTGRTNGAHVDDFRHTWVHSSASDPPEDEILGGTDEELFPRERSRPTSEFEREAIETDSRVEAAFTFIEPCERRPRRRTHQDRGRRLAGPVLRGDWQTAGGPPSVVERGVEDVRSSSPESAAISEGPVPDVTVIADGMLESVFRNLLKTATQHNDRAIPEVTVSVADRDESVVVRVADNGPGIDDRHEDAIFGRGEKGLGSAGPGIGLYLVRTLVENYGGDVRVGDNEPDGSVFTVELPKAGR